MNHQFCESLVAADNSVEAAIILQAGMEPVCHTRGFKPVDDLLVVVNNLIIQSHELNLFFNTDDASMMFETTFGALYIVIINPETLVVLCLNEGYSLQLLNQSLRRCITERHL